MITFIFLLCFFAGYAGFEVRTSGDKIGGTPPDGRLAKFWKHSFNFNGKTNRRDFWITQGLIFLLYLFSVLISITLFLDRNFGIDYNYTYYQWNGVRQYILVSIYGFSAVSLIPSISLQVRRLRDAAKNPW